MSLVRFTRSQVDKYLLFGADSPPAQQITDTRLNGATIGEMRVPPDMGTPSPVGTLTSIGIPRPQSGPAQPTTPRGGSRRKSGLSKMPLAVENVEGKPLSKTKTNLKLSPQVPPKKSRNSNSDGEKREARSDGRATKNDGPKSGRKSHSKLKWLVFTIPNVLALLFILFWLLYLR